MVIAILGREEIIDRIKVLCGSLKGLVCYAANAHRRGMNVRKWALSAYKTLGGSLLLLWY